MGGAAPCRTGVGRVWPGQQLGERPPASRRRRGRHLGGGGSGAPRCTPEPRRPPAPSGRTPGLARARAPAEPVVGTAVPAAVQALQDQLARVVYGSPQPLQLTIAAFLASGHVLLEDQPGVGKTLLAKALARSLGGSFGRVQGTPDLLPSDVTGVSIYEEDTHDWRFQPGPLFNQVVLVDELNRATPRTQSALLEGMAERQVSIDGTTHALPSPFFVIATQNPQDDVGTFPLVAGQRDRFTVSVSMGLPGREAERLLVRGYGGEAALAQRRAGGRRGHLGGPAGRARRPHLPARRRRRVRPRPARHGATSARGHREPEHPRPPWPCCGWRGGWRWSAAATTWPPTTCRRWRPRAWRTASSTPPTITCRRPVTG